LEYYKKIKNKKAELKTDERNQELSDLHICYSSKFYSVCNINVD